MNLNPLFTCTLQKNRFLQREQQQKEIAAVTQEKFLKAPVYYPSTEAETLHGWKPKYGFQVPKGAKHINLKVNLIVWQKKKTFAM